VRKEEELVVKHGINRSKAKLNKSFEELGAHAGDQLSSEVPDAKRAGLP
jgi:hypothetical protein